MTHAEEQARRPEVPRSEPQDSTRAANPGTQPTVARVVSQGEQLKGADVVLMDRETSVAGKVVTLSRAINRYAGAQAYFMVLRSGGQVRYPVTEQRARRVFTLYTQDITDPQAVKDHMNDDRKAGA